MARPCPACQHPQRDAIDSALRRGEGLRGLEAQTGLSRSRLSLHRRTCLGLVGRVEVAEAPQDSQDAQDKTAGPGCLDGSKTSHGDARARAKVDPKSLQSFEDRVSHCADLIASGRWTGRPTAKRLAALWGVERGTVQDYRRAAAIVARTDRGALEETREEALGHWGRLRGKAVANGELKVAVAAQAGHDRASGVVEAGGAKVQINLLQAPEFKQAVQVVMAAIAPWPEAFEAAKAALRGELAARGRGPALQLVQGGGGRT